MDHGLGAVRTPPLPPKTRRKRRPRPKWAFWEPVPVTAWATYVGEGGKKTLGIRAPLRTDRHPGGPRRRVPASYWVLWPGLPYRLTCQARDRA